jgi:uncharacterized protein YeaO (DUF488 family)
VLTRYKIYRGKRPPSDPLPSGIRQDTRWRTKHPLRPTEQMVTKYLAAPSEKAWRTFRKAYLALLERRFREDRAKFDALARLARDKNVFLGCSCHTKKNPRVDRCHTWLALEFMQRKYPDLRVEFPLPLKER